MGAGKWTEDLGHWFRGRRVCILPDNDPPGQKHAQDVARKLAGIAAEIRILNLPGLGPKGDIIDWLNDGHTKDELLNLLENTPSWQPTTIRQEEAISIQANENLYQEFVKQIPWTQENIEKLISYNLTEAGNAELFRDLVGNSFRFIPERGVWVRFDGVRWKEDSDSASLQMLAIVRKRIDAANLTAGLHVDERRAKVIKWALVSESNHHLKAALEIASWMLAKKYTEFDQDPWLLCCANGVLDLRLDGNGFRQAKPDDWLHRSCGIAYDPDAECPQWMRFQEEICCGDQELIRFKQLAYGYSLTGLTSEQCLFLCWGTGANGKSTELAILESLLGEYAISTPASTFKEKYYSNDSIPNDIARMVGARLVKTIEVKEHARLNEERIKALTGGDRICARFLHREYFDFWPIAKIWIAANHKPIIKGTDEAIWRRIRLIPYLAYFPPEKRDYKLIDKLRDELAGILKWAVDGCYLWQIHGLKPAKAVHEATQEYRQESDVIGQFLAECTVTGEDKRVKAGDLWEAYQRWCGGKGNEEISQTAFGRKIRERGFLKVSQKGYPYYSGIGLKDDWVDSF
ncbi:MAG: phage/plasmid primase, P4 family [Nitrososphaerota archaeon]